MVDRLLPLRLQREAVIRKGERAVEKAARAYIEQALTLVNKAFNRDTGFLDDAVLDARDLDPSGLVATIEEVAAAAAVEGAQRVRVALNASAVDQLLQPEFWAGIHILTEVQNRLARVPDTVFNEVRTAIAIALRDGKSIPDIAAAIDSILITSGSERWANRAVTIARTETIAAFNAGQRAGTFAQAEQFGIEPGEVVRQWVATADSSTRESHAEADGQQVLGEESYYDVGGSLLTYPGDPAGPPEEVINCRCTEVFLMPGDPDYPTDLPASGDPPQAFRDDGNLPDTATLSAADTNPWAAAQAANPNYGKGQEWRVNCTNCVGAWDARMRGYNVLADAYLGPQSTAQVLRHWWRIGARNGAVSRYAVDAEYDRIVGKISAAWPDGSWGSISVVWRSGGGHIFGWVKDGGSVKFFDPQVGAQYSQYDFIWDKVRPGSLAQVARLDNAIPNGYGTTGRN